MSEQPKVTTVDYRDVLRAEAERLGRRPRVGEPVVLTINKRPRQITPCSGWHRGLWLGGWIVASCTKCKAVTVDG